MTSKKGLTICLVVICISTVYGAVALPNNDQKFLILAYKNFDNSNKVCTSEANWCNYTGNQTKAIIYGYLQKKIKIPEGVDELDVAIQLSSDGWGEGLAVSIDKWTPNSAVRIKIDEDIKETKISKLPDGDPHIHHSSYYKYEFGQRIFYRFNISGKNSALLTIQMVDGARMDFDSAILTFRSNKTNSDLTQKVVEKYQGICYGPYRDNENPDSSIYPTHDEIKEDIIFLENITNSIRTYSVADNLVEIPHICQDSGMDCYIGSWISKDKIKNHQELQRLIQVANQNYSHVKGLIIGNEVLLRQDLSEEELIAYINKARNETHVPVGTADVWNSWISHPRLADRVDFILIHVHPYWEAIDVGNASSFVVEKWEDLQAKYPNKPVIIGETGWPSGGEPNGEAIPSQDNQKKFMRDFLNLADYYNIPYFYFEAFDERWKIRSESSAGANWGIYYSNGTLKQAPKKGSSLIKASNEFNRSLRMIKANIPWSIYADGDLSDNRFYPTGWMGELEKWQGDPKDILNLSCTESPFSKKYCIKITYKPHINEWGGIYWQYPSNNWGESPGYNLSIAKKLTFWARGEKGGEKAEFKAGGIEDFGKPFKDSFGPISTGIIELKKNWEKHSIDLSGQDLSMVIGGFCWTTNWEQNPDGATIYIDDIKYE